MLLISRIKTNKLFICLVITLFMIVQLTGVAEASFDRSHINVQCDAGTGQWNGGDYRATTRSIDSKWSSTIKDRFALKSMWLEVNGKGSYDWIELGFMDGATINSTYHKGFYTAYAILDGNTLTYQEWKITGPSNGKTYKYQSLMLVTILIV